MSITAEFPDVVKRPKQNIPSNGPPRAPKDFKHMVSILSNREARNAKPKLIPPNTITALQFIHIINARFEKPNKPVTYLEI